MRKASRGEGYPDNRAKFWTEYWRAEGRLTQDQARLWTWANSLQFEHFTGFWPLRCWPTWVIGNLLGLKDIQQRDGGRRDNNMRYRLLSFFLHNGMNRIAARAIVLCSTVSPEGVPVPGDYNKNAIQDVDKMIEKFDQGLLQYSVYDMLQGKVVDHKREQQ